MPIEIDGERYLNSAETAKYLRLSRTTIDDLVNDGRLTRYKQGIRRLSYYKQSELDDLLRMRPDSPRDED